MSFVKVGRRTTASNGSAGPDRHGCRGGTGRRSCAGKSRGAGSKSKQRPEEAHPCGYLGAAEGLDGCQGRRKFQRGRAKRRSGHTGRRPDQPRIKGSADKPPRRQPSAVSFSYLLTRSQKPFASRLRSCVWRRAAGPAHLPKDRSARGRPRGWSRPSCRPLWRSRLPYRSRSRGQGQWRA